MKCCWWALLLCAKKKPVKVAPDAVDSTCRGSQLEHKRTLSIRYEKSNMSITVLEEPGSGDAKKQAKPKKKNGSLSKVKPKVYGVMKGSSSICHTPVPEKSPLLQSKKVVIRKGEPQSALLVSDSAAKKELLRLKAGRSHSEDHGNEEAASP